MKSILTTAALVLLSLNVFAGPEEHIAAQTCYSLKSPAPTVIPQRVCLEEITITEPHTDTATINIYSYFNQNYFNNMKLTYLARHNEDSYAFRAANILLENYESGCGSAEKATLQVNGRVDVYGVGQPEYVDIAVKYETLVDTCHSKTQVRTYEYIKD